MIVLAQLVTSLIVHLTLILNHFILTPKLVRLSIIAILQILIKIGILGSMSYQWILLKLLAIDSLYNLRLKLIHPIK